MSSQDEQKPVFRRVRRSEHSKLIDLCKADVRWAKYYSEEGHQKWLKRALYDVQNSTDRVVIGAFIGGGLEKQLLVGCVFLKKSHFEHCVEFKNIIVLENLKDTEIERQLIEKAINFCEIRNVERIEAELPYKEQQLISHFATNNFKIVSFRERHNPNVQVCLLERLIGDYYHADPFDQQKFAFWLLKQFLPCIITNVVSSNGLTEIYFESKKNSFAFSKTNDIGYNKRLCGVIFSVMRDDSGSFLEDIVLILKKAGTIPLKLILVDSITQEEKELLQNNSFIVFDKTDALEIAGGNRSSLNIPFDIGNVGGVITVLEQNTIVRLSKKDTITYYLFSGINAGLLIYENLDVKLKNKVSNPLIAIYCPNWRGNAGIIGYFKVISIISTTFERLLAHPTPPDSGLTTKDLEFYSIYSEEDRIVQAKCIKMILFDKPLPMIHATWISDKLIESYINREIIHNTNNTTYLDIKSCENLIKYSYNKKNEKKTNEKTGDSGLRSSDHTSKSYNNQVKKDMPGKILFIAANPTNESRIQTDKEYRIIKEEMQRGSHRDSFIFLQPQLSVTISDFIRAMNDKPNIIHFSGHGNDKGITIVTDDNKSMQLSNKAMERLFKPLESITELVILNSCYSVSQAKLISTYGMYVIGNNLPIGDNAAISFSKGLYNGISSGKDIQASFNDAMIAILAENPQYTNVIEIWKNGAMLSL